MYNRESDDKLISDIVRSHRSSTELNVINSNSYLY